jgi:hypothetical protein
MRGTLAEELARIGGPWAVSLRDVHGDNLIWRPETGTGRIASACWISRTRWSCRTATTLRLWSTIRAAIVPADWRDDLIRDYAAARHQEWTGWRVSTSCRCSATCGSSASSAGWRRSYGRPDYARFFRAPGAFAARASAHPALHRLHARGGRAARANGPLGGGGRVSFPCLILAAGFGTRMGALTRTGPRP